jgi:hypothetical protein
VFQQVVIQSFADLLKIRFGIQGAFEAQLAGKFFRGQVALFPKRD